MHQFKLLWRPKGSNKDKTADYMATDLKSMLRIAWKQHNASPNTTEFMYVHMIMPDGKVEEYDVHESTCSVIGEPCGDGATKYKAPKAAPPDEAARVTASIKSIIKQNRKNKKKQRHEKPRVKLTQDGPVSMAAFIEAGNGLYYAQPTMKMR